MAATTDKTEDEKKFWLSGKTELIFGLITKGKSAEEICDELKMFDETFVRTVNSSYFSKRIQRHLNAKFYTYQITKLEDALHIYKRLKTEFENRIGEASDDCIVKEFLKLALGKEEKKLVIPKLLEVLGELADKKEAPEKIGKEGEKVIKEHFGFDPLKLPSKDEQLATPGSELDKD